ncbi:hypothetical protein CsSME_00006232 [Camellia sinensis var. sinensis]
MMNYCTLWSYSVLPFQIWVVFSICLHQSFRRTKNFPWQRDLFEDSLRAAGLNGVENGTKLYISNLDIGVTNEDIKELFSEIGQLKRYTVHYDKNGRPSLHKVGVGHMETFAKY